MKMNLMPFIKKAAAKGKAKEKMEPMREEKKEAKMPPMKRKMIEKREK